MTCILTPKRLGCASLAALLLVSVAANGQISPRTYHVLDPLAVPADGDASAAVVKVTPPPHVNRLHCDVVVAGGGMGGVAAALASAHEGMRVCLTEATKWLGGQMTSQAVAALDENRWIEDTGATRTYQELRHRIRDAYAPNARADQLRADFNPGACWVSALCFEPSVAVTVLEKMLAPHEKDGVIRVFKRTVVVDARKDDGKLRRVLVYSFDERRFTEIEGTIFIDATELGDLLPLAGASFRTGADARGQTGEPDAPETARPQELQSFNVPFVLALQPEPGIAIQRPSTWERDRERFSLTISEGEGKTLRYGMFADFPGTAGSFWTYRRLIAKDQFVPGARASDLALINWDSNDVCDPGYLSADPYQSARAFQHGKQVSLAFAWWLREQAPHDADSGHGFPELVMKGDVVGSSDGLSQHPYIRESRRMEALSMIREQDLAEPWQAGARARAFDDSGGIGYYPIDIHGCGATFRLPVSKPYQIPLSALVARDVSNLLAGAKNLGSTHITNGAYRLHPTEWATGEASGMLAAEAVRRQEQPAAILRNSKQLRALQRRLLKSGHPLVWFDDVPLEHPNFEAIQFVSLVGLLPLQADSMHFRPDVPVTGDEAATALRNLAKLVPLAAPVSTEAEARALLTWSELAHFGHGMSHRGANVLRGEFAQWLASWLAER
jgi:hypothetical protein